MFLQTPDRLSLVISGNNEISWTLKTDIKDENWSKRDWQNKSVKVDSKIKFSSLIWHLYCLIFTERMGDWWCHQKEGWTGLLGVAGAQQGSCLIPSPQQGKPTQQHHGCAWILFCLTVSGRWLWSESVEEEHFWCSGAAKAHSWWRDRVPAPMHCHHAFQSWKLKALKGTFDICQVFHPLAMLQAATWN